MDDMKRVADSFGAVDAAQRISNQLEKLSTSRAHEAESALAKTLATLAVSGHVSDVVKALDAIRESRSVTKILDDARASVALTQAQTSFASLSARIAAEAPSFLAYSKANSLTQTISTLAEESRRAFERPLQSFTAMLEADSGSAVLKKYSSGILDAINDAKALAAPPATALAFAKLAEPAIDANIVRIETHPERLFSRPVEKPVPKQPSLKVLALQRIALIDAGFAEWCDALPLECEGRMLMPRVGFSPMEVTGFDAEEGGLCRVYGTVDGIEECYSLHYLDVKVVYGQYKPHSPGDDFETHSVH